MKTEDRHKQILTLAKEKGFLSTDELTLALKVTPQTIRRDINELCAKGLLRRFHGGAGLASSIENVGYAARQVMNYKEKNRIAAQIAAHIPNGASLFINIGTSTEEVAKALLNHQNLRIITNNLNVASLLCHKADFELILAGGVVRADRGVIGESALDFIRQFKVDYGIIGISGIDIDGTLLDFDYREVRAAQAIIDNARQTFLAADHSKFSCHPMVRLGPISLIDMLFTDKNPPDEILSVLQKSDVKLVVADKRSKN